MAQPGRLITRGTPRPGHPPRACYSHPNDSPSPSSPTTGGSCARRSSGPRPTPCPPVSDRLACTWEVSSPVRPLPRYHFDLDAIRTRTAHRHSGDPPDTVPGYPPVTVHCRGPDRCREPPGSHASKPPGSPGTRRQEPRRRVDPRHLHVPGASTSPRSTPARRTAAPRHLPREGVRRLRHPMAPAPPAPPPSPRSSRAVRLQPAHPARVLCWTRSSVPAPSASSPRPTTADWIGIRLNPAFAQLATDPSPRPEGDTRTRGERRHRPLASEPNRGGITVNTTERG